VDDLDLPLRRPLDLLPLVEKLFIQREKIRLPPSSVFRAMTVSRSSI